MNAIIYSHLTVIGKVDLQIGDESMGAVFGEFIPNEYYFKYIQNNVWEFWSTNKPDYNKWNRLRFNVQLENGCFLFPSGGYTIDDNNNLADEPKRIDIIGVNLDIFKFNFEKLPKSWNFIDIGQKISFEDELEKEITPTKKFLNILFFNDRHPLFGSQFSALAKYESNDDILFEVSKDGEISRFVVVHLTWIGKKERSNSFPSTHFYLDFDDFVERRIKKDDLV